MTKKKDNRPRDKRLAPIADAQPVAVPVLTEAQALARPHYIEIAPGVSVGPGVDIVPAVEHRNPHGRLAYVDTTAPVPAVVLPVGKRGDKGFVWELDALWTERIEKMAQVAGLTPQRYLDSLLRRAWVGLDQRHRGGL